MRVTEDYFDFVFSFILNKRLVERLGKEYVNRISHENLKKRLTRIFSLILLRLRAKPVANTQQGPVANRILFFAETINQTDALKTIAESLSEPSLFVFPASKQHFANRLSNSENVYLIDESQIRRYFHRLPGFLFRSFAGGAHFVFRYFDALVQNFGYVDLFNAHLDSLKPKAIIMSNDHNIVCRTLLWCAKQKGIPTIYVQHAAVSNIFPKLQFDLALLDGMDACNKYDKDDSVVVKVVGSAKLASFCLHRKFNKRFETIGVCYSPYDSLNALDQLVQLLAAKYAAISILVRRHPGDSRPIPDFSGLPNVHFSDAKKENVLDYLKKTDVLVAGNSSVHLEATSMNIVSIYYEPLSAVDIVYDYYGFVEHKMIPAAPGATELYQAIDRFEEDVYLKARYFAHNVGEDFEATVPDILLKEITAFISRFSRNTN